VKLIVTSGSGHAWTEDDNDNMPSISKELQDVDKLNKDGSNWRIFEAQILIGTKALNMDQYLTTEPTDPTGDADKIATHKATRGQLLNAIVQKLPSDVFIRHVKDDTPHKLLTSLKAKYGAVNIAATAAIEARMFSLRCKTDGNMRNYISKMLELKGQLTEAGTDTNISDTCFRDAILPGTCSAGPSYVVIVESLIMTYTVLGQTSLLTSGVVITVLRVAYDSSTAVKRDDNNKGGAHANSAAPQHNNQRGRGRGHGRGRGNGSTQCGGGHQNNNLNRKCYNCQGIGHLSSDCPLPKRERSQQANLATPKKAKDSKKPADATTGTAAAAGLAQAQDTTSSTTAWTAVAG
jgi:hypothetical protein